MKKRISGVKKMNEKYLPIGTICTLKGKNKKVMIVGVYGVEFNGNLKINDYTMNISISKKGV